MIALCLDVVDHLEATNRKLERFLRTPPPRSYRWALDD
jgi:hypothetical protein